MMNLKRVSIGLIVLILAACNSGSNTANNITPADTNTNTADRTKNGAITDTGQKTGDTTLGATKVQPK